MVCTCSGNSAFSKDSGIIHTHNYPSSKGSPEQYLESLDEGVHASIQLLSYFHEQDKSYWTFRLSVIQISNGRGIEKTTNEFLTSFAGKPLDGTMQPSFLCAEDRFGLSDLEITYGQPKNSLSLYGKTDEVTPINYRANFIVSANAEQTISISQESLVETEIVQGCFYIDRDCFHDRCCRVGFCWPCNYRCVARACGNNRVCGEWRKEKDICTLECL